jgi:cytochrome c
MGTEVIKNWNWDKNASPDDVRNGSAIGFTGVRDAKIFANEISGEIQTDSPKVKAITNYNRWLAQEVLRRNAESK